MRAKAKASPMESSEAGLKLMSRCCSLVSQMLLHAVAAAAQAVLSDMGQHQDIQGGHTESRTINKQQRGQAHAGR